MSDDLTLYCANHPQNPTTLRCNRCEKPICTKCATLTPTGYRCRECLRSQQKVYSTAEWFDYLSAAIVASLLGFLGSLIVPRLGFFTIFLAPVAGGIIAEVVRFVVRRRRSKRLFQLATGAAVIGSLPLVVLSLLGSLSGVGSFNLYALIFHGVYSFGIASTVYYRLSGISIR